MTHKRDRQKKCRLPKSNFCTLKTRKAGSRNRLRDREIGQFPCTDQS